MYYNYLRATRCVLLSWLDFIGWYLDPISTNEQCVTSARQYYLLGQYCENIVFVLTQYSYLILTLCKLSCNGGTPLHLLLTARCGRPHLLCRIEGPPHETLPVISFASYMSSSLLCIHLKKLTRTARCFRWHPPLLLSASMPFFLHFLTEQQKVQSVQKMLLYRFRDLKLHEINAKMATNLTYRFRNDLSPRKQTINNLRSEANPYFEFCYFVLQTPSNVFTSS